MTRYWRWGLFAVVGVVGNPMIACKRSERTEVAAVTGYQTAELNVQGTDCASCDVTIRRHLHKLAGVRDIRQGQDKQHVVVDFDPKQVTPEQIAKAVADAGYIAEIYVHSVSS